VGGVVGVVRSSLSLDNFNLSANRRPDQRDYVHQLHLPPLGDLKPVNTSNPGHFDWGEEGLGESKKLHCCEIFYKNCAKLLLQWSRT